MQYKESLKMDITQRPAYLGESKTGGFAETIGFARPPRIIANDGFSVVGDGGELVLPRSIDLKVIMLWENDTRLYYPKGEYDSANPSPPACYSDNRVTPSAGALQPQSDLCASCAHSVWDQPTPRGNLVPACDSRYKVACLVAGAGGKVFLLSVAPSSRKPYELYRKYLKQHNTEANDVVTTLTYSDKQLGFQVADWVDEKTAAFIKKVAATNEPAEIVGSTDKPRTPALPKPEYQPMQQVAGNNLSAPALVAGNAVPSTTPASFGEPEPVVEDRPTRPATVVKPPSQGKPRGRPPKEAPTKEMFGDQGLQPFADQRAAAQFGQAPVAPAARPTAQQSPAPSWDSPGSGQGLQPFADQRSINQNGVQGFGMEAPQAPSSDVQRRLDEAFGPR